MGKKYECESIVKDTLICLYITDRSMSLVCFEHHISQMKQVVKVFIALLKVWPMEAS